MPINPASVNDIKNTLKSMKDEQLREFLLRVVKYKKENKEFLSYILFMEDDIPQFIRDVKNDMEENFAALKSGTTYTRTKALRKLLRGVNKYIKFSANKTVETELLIHFCRLMAKSSVNPEVSTALFNIYHRQLSRIHKAISALHEDVQADYKSDLQEIML